MRGRAETGRCVVGLRRLGDAWLFWIGDTNGGDWAMRGWSEENGRCVVGLRRLGDAWSV